MVGGLIRWWIDRKRKEQTEHDPGTLTSAGLVAGVGLMGVALAGVAAIIGWLWSSPKWANPFHGGALEAVMPSHFIPWIWTKFGSAEAGAEPWIAHWGLREAWWNALPMLPFAALAVWLYLCARKRPKVVLPPDGGTPVEPVEPEPTLPSSSEDDSEAPPHDSGPGNEPSTEEPAAMSELADVTEPADTYLVADDSAPPSDSGWALDLPSESTGQEETDAGEVETTGDLGGEDPLGWRREARPTRRPPESDVWPDSSAFDTTEPSGPTEPTEPTDAEESVDGETPLSEIEGWSPPADEPGDIPPVSEPDEEPDQLDSGDDPWRPNPDERF